MWPIFLFHLFLKDQGVERLAQRIHTAVCYRPFRSQQENFELACLPSSVFELEVFVAWWLENSVCFLALHC